MITKKPIQTQQGNHTLELTAVYDSTHKTGICSSHTESQHRKER